MSLELAPARRRDRGEAIIPMINVVFLLLVFFLMTAQLAPPAPVAVSPPESGAGEVAGPAPELVLPAAGEIAFGAARGPAALAAFVREAHHGAQPPRLRADAGRPAGEVARLLRALAAAGLEGVALIVAPR